MDEKHLDPGLVEFWTKQSWPNAIAVPYNTWVLIHYRAYGQPWSVGGRVTKRRHRDTPLMPRPEEVYLRLVSGGLMLIPRVVESLDLINPNNAAHFEQTCPAKLTADEKDERERLLRGLAREGRLVNVASGT